MLETQHLRIMFEVLDPYLGCLVLETQHLRIIFEVLDPDLGCLVLETQHLRIIFEVLDLHLGCLVLETHLPRKCLKNINFLHGLGATRHSEADEPDEPDEIKILHDRQFRP